MATDPTVQTSILTEYPRMSPDDSFTFQCHQGLECFTRCCRDVSIVLTPYDVLRLKRAGLDSTEFLRRHTITPFTADQKFPAVLLKMDPETKACGFVGPEGCGVYRIGRGPAGCTRSGWPSRGKHADRPRVPLPAPRGSVPRPRPGPTLTVREWLGDQGIEQYDMMGASFKALMLHEFWDKTDGLTPQQMEMYYMACFDLDRFRRFVFESRFLQTFEVDEARAEAMRTTTKTSSISPCSGCGSASSTRRA